MASDAETNFEKLKKALDAASLPADDHRELTALFAAALDEELEPVVALFVEDPSWIKKINENYKTKRAAISSGDASAWSRIVEEEARELGTLHDQ